MTVTIPDKTCGRLGCNNDKNLVKVRDPKKGTLVVCPGDVDGREVIERV